MSKGHNGLFVSPKNEGDFYDKMLKLYEDKVLYEILKINSRTYVTAKYEQNALWDATLQSYKLISE
jgi:dsDNA-binding SOS-regulon protein